MRAVYLHIVRSTQVFKVVDYSPAYDPQTNNLDMYYRKRTRVNRIIYKRQKKNPRNIH